MSFILLGILNSQASGGGASPYWFSYSATTGFYGVSPTFEVNGQTTNASNQAGLLVKLNQADGSIDWQRYVQNTSGDIRTFGTTGIVSAGSNLYALFQDEFTGNSDIVVMKLNQTPSIVAQRRLGTSNNVKLSTFGNLAVDGSENVYAVGYEETSPYRGLVAKWNSSLTHQWTRQIADFNTNFVHFNTRVAVDTAGNVIASSQRNPPGSGVTGNHVVKWNSSGTAQWQRLISGTNDLPFAAIATDSSNNIYTAYRDQPNQGWGITKINSSGSKQWEKTLYESNEFPSNSPYLHFGADGNIYLTGEYGNGTTGLVTSVIASISQSGTLNWQTNLSVTFSGAARNTVIQASAIDSNGNLVITGNFFTPSGTRAFTATLLSDGSTLGSFTDGVVTVNLTAASKTYASTPFNFGTPSDSVTGATVTEAASSLALGTSTLTADTVQLG